MHSNGLTVAQSHTVICTATSDYLSSCMAKKYLAFIPCKFIRGHLETKINFVVGRHVLMNTSRFCLGLCASGIFTAV